MCNHFYSSTFRILHLVNLYAHWPFLPSPLPGSLLSVFCFCDFDCSEVIKYSSVCVWVCERETTLFHIALISLELTHVELYVMISFLFEGESYSNACVDQFYFSVHPLMSTWLALFFFFLTALYMSVPQSSSRLCFQFFRVNTQNWNGWVIWSLLVFEKQAI